MTVLATNPVNTRNTPFGGKAFLNFVSDNVLELQQLRATTEVIEIELIQRGGVDLPRRGRFALRFTPGEEGKEQTCRWERIS